MKTLYLMVLISVSTWCLGCGAHTSLVPLDKGQLAPYLSLGGPIVEAFDTHIPIPYLLVGTDYGLRENVTVNASVHLLPLAYSVAGFDVGAVWFPLENDGWQPTLGIGPRLFAFASTKSDVEERLLVYPAVSSSAAWEAGLGVLYTGADLSLPLAQQDYDDEAKPLIFSPFIGYQWDLGKRYALLTELKWHGANIKTDRVITGYTGIGHQGAITPLIALQKRF